MKPACKFLIVLLITPMFLVGCEKIKEMTGLSHDDVKAVENCKTLELGMNTSDMLGIMGKPMSKNIGMGDKSGLKHYVFTSSLSAKVAVVVRVNIDSDEVVQIQCEKGYNLGDILT